MGIPPSRKLGREVHPQAQEAVQTLMEHLHGQAHIAAQPRDTRMGKLFCHQHDERQVVRHRRPPSHNVAQSDMEAVENPEQASMGTSEVRR